VADQLKPNEAEIAHLLRWVLSDATVHLEHMTSEGTAPPKVLRLPASDGERLEGLLRTQNGGDRRRNMYWVPDGQFFEGGKRNKANLKAAQFLHVDLDFKDYPGSPEEQRARVEALLRDPEIRPSWIPAPTVVYMTGGGYQALWRLQEPAEPDQVEVINRALLTGMEGGPGTHDPGRLLRLPGTVNWLNDKKRKDGREPELGFIAAPTTFDEPPVSYRLEDFEPPEEPSEAPTAVAASNSRKIENAPPLLPAALPSDPLSALPNDPTWRAAIAHGVTPPGKTYASRSERTFASTIWMLSHGVPADVALAVLLAPSLAIGDHIRDRSGDHNSALAYAQRQVRRAQNLLDAKRTSWPDVNEKLLPVSQNPNNIRYALARLGIAIHRNEFTGEDEVEGGGFENRDVNDIADILASEFVRTLQFNASAAAIKREITALAHENRYHPVRDYLGGLRWDGVRRLDTWLFTYCGAEDTPLHRAFSAKTPIAAVRRIKQPGVKFDTMLVLEGPQGCGKSTVARILAVNDAWFCESLSLRADDRERALVLQRAWIVECQELDGLNKVQEENLKKFLSESTDTIRKPYDRNARQYPRHCVIIGTTNKYDYLRDRTGNRRFWPVRVGEIDLKGLQAVVDQLWAEAAQREADGEDITLSPELWPDAEVAQRQRLAEDPFADVLAGALGDGPGKISMESIKMLLDIPTGRMSANDSRRIKAVMAEQGWRHGNYRFWNSAARMRQPAKGFVRQGDGEEVREIGVRKARDGQLEVGEVDAHGKIKPVRGADEGEDEIPF